MWPSCSFHVTLLALGALASTTSSQQVPLAIANTTSNANANKVPTDAGGDVVAGFMPLQQSPASIFFVNYNQQNAMQLRHSMEGKLRNIRNVEMRVAKIQVSHCAVVSEIRCKILVLCRKSSTPCT